MIEHHVVHHECCWHPYSGPVDMAHHVTGYAVVSCCCCCATVDIDPFELFDELEISSTRHNGKAVA